MTRKTLSALANRPLSPGIFVFLVAYFGTSLPGDSRHSWRLVTRYFVRKSPAHNDGWIEFLTCFRSSPRGAVNSEQLD